MKGFWSEMPVTVMIQGPITFLYPNLSQCMSCNGTIVFINRDKVPVCVRPEPQTTYMKVKKLYEHNLII